MTVSSQTRKAGPYSGTGSTGPFTFSFKVFQASDLLVVKADSSGIETTLTLTTDYTVSLNADQNANPGGTITLVAALAVGYTMVISSQVPYLQETDLTNQGGFYPEVITDALDKLTIEAQQLKGEVDRSAKLPITSTADADALVADIIRIADSADNLDTVANNIGSVNTVATNISNVNTVAGISSNVTTVAGISANVTTVAGNTSNINTVASNNANVTAVGSNIANVNAVAGNATNINAVNANSANINTVATNISSVNNCSTNMAAIIDAPNQAASAAASAAAAAAAVASGLYSAVQDKSANYTVAAADAGDLIRVTTTSGNITMTLPTIGSTGIGDGFKIAITKWTGDTNTVTVNRSGSDTINGATSYSINSQYSVATFVADLETGQWFAVAGGVGSTNIVIDTYNGTGSATGFTLSGSPGTRNNTQVFISGVYQAKATYTVTDATLTFTTAPPAGTGNIEVVWTQPLAIGVPSDGTITARKLDVATADGTGAATLPTGTTAQRPGVPTTGMFRYNSTNAAFEGYNGSAWAGVGGASGAGGNPFVYENDKVVTASYSITSGKNAMSAGPITINDGVTVTIPDGSVWTVV